MNLEINETKKKKFEYNIKLLNLIELEKQGLFYQYLSF